MKTLFRFVSTVCILLTSVLGHAQDESISDALRYTVSIPSPVHFFDSEGQDTLVPAGAYWVSPEDGGLQLLNLENGEAFIIPATSQTPDEELSAARALTTPVIEDDPDVFLVAFKSVDGSQLVAVGSYSGIRSRGLCGTRCQQVRANAIRAAAVARQRAEQAAAEARRLAEQAASRAREAAADNTNQLLLGIAQAAGRGDSKEVARLTALAAPRLVVLAPASLSASEKVQLISAARQQLAIHRSFIEDVGRRIAANRPLFSTKGQPLGAERIKSIGMLIWGEDGKRIQHPFLSPGVQARGGADTEVTARGESAISGVAFTVGISFDVGLVVGVGAGSQVNVMIPPISIFVPNCSYGDAHASIGAEVSAGVNADVGFWARNPRELAGSDFTVDIGGALGLGVDVGFVFERGGLLGFSLSGITISPGAGGGVDVSVNIGTSTLIGCGNQLLL